MKHYELTYLISPELSEEELKNFSKKITDFVQEETGTIEKTGGPFKKKLDHPIKKKEGAFLATLNFSLSPEKLENLEKKIKSENRILRYIILTRKITRGHLPSKERPRWKLPLREQLLRPDSQRPKIPQKIKESKKVDLKEIDKKIEEILKE